MSSFPFPDFSADADDTNQVASMLDLVDPTSPSSNTAHTPAESVALSLHYQSSDYSDLDFENNDDSYFNAFFGGVGGNTPSILSGDDTAGFDLLANPAATAAVPPYATPEQTHATLNGNKALYPLSPDKTPSLNTSPPPPASQRFVVPGSAAGQNLVSRDITSAASLVAGGVSPQQPTKQPPTSTPFPEFVVSDAATQLTPDTASSGDSLRHSRDSRGSLSTEGGRTSTGLTMAGPNPQVTVSHWGKDGATVPPDASAAAIPTADPASHIARSVDDSVLPTQTGVSRDQQGAWLPSATTGLGGLDPSNRSPTELATNANEDAQVRQVQKRNQEIGQWLNSAEDTDPAVPFNGQEPVFVGVSDREIALGNETQNVPQPGRTYFNEDVTGPPNATDYELMLQGHAWDSAPTRLPISQGGHRYQPESSQAAIERFERMYRDNASIVSRAATWGTRRRSLPSVYDIEGVTSGSFLKKLSLSRGDTRRPSILGGLRDLVRKPSTSQLKRTRSNQDDDQMSSSNDDPYSPQDSRRDSKATTNSTLAPPSRTQSWAKNKQSMPSINTALVSMGSSVASVGTTHARSGSVSRPHAGSISLSPPVMSPKSPSLLKVSNSIRRRRSKSDLPKPTMDNPKPNLVRMLKATGGPPVANLANTNAIHTAPAAPHTPTPITIPATKVAVPDPDDDDDEEDEPLDDGDLKTESDELIDRITPDFSGFRELVLGLNPMLAEMNTYLVDRIAHQQIVRYKGLLNNKVKHLGHVRGQSCSNKGMCVEQGGSAVLLDSRGDPRSLDPLSTKYEPSDVDDLASPLDGAINAESFPKYIPMPPTGSLPAEFECQLCFQTKTFLKPSDWTKHVHEDVQPFTCTWDRCRDPKIFKRKADWVRHENEGHRHLEWWTCDVEECRHTCYRRDNFLQHLVREHKFREPQHKTKAAIKRAGAGDTTWQRVEKCHTETSARPQDEPCRFCGKTFPTWKKLTVHLAKHMEHISLPILRLVERKELEADTLISPVQDPPPRTFAPPTVFPGSIADQQHQMHQQQGGIVMGGLASNLMAQGPGGGGGLHHLGTTMGYTTDQSGYVYPPVSQVAFHSPFYGQSQFATAGGLSMPMQNLDAAALDMSGVGGGAPQQSQYTTLPVTTGAYLGSTPTQAQYLSDPPAMDTSYSTLATANALGLQGHLTPGQMYDPVVDPSVAGSGSGRDQFTPHGSVSPFGHSPHQVQGQFYGQQ